MTKAEKIAEAFGRGLAQGLTGGTDAPSTPEPQALPQVIPMDSIREAVREVLVPLIEAEQDVPTGDQLDMFTHRIEDAPPDENAERIRQRLEETRLRKEEAERERTMRPGEYDPNMPNASPWTSPSDPHPP